MRSGFYIPLPPSDLPPQAAAWAAAVTDILRSLPFSFISTTDGPNSSGVSANYGVIAVDVGSAVTSFWQKRSASTSTIGWSAFSWI